MRSIRHRSISVMALAAIGSLGTGTPTAETEAVPEPKPEANRVRNHWPHQGKKECARRLRRMAEGKAQ